MMFKAEARSRRWATAAARSGFVGHRNNTCGPLRFQIARHVIGMPRTISTDLMRTLELDTVEICFNWHVH